MKWWEKNRVTLQQELDDLVAANMQPQLQKDMLKQGKVVITVNLQLFGNQHLGKIIYPDLYPYFRPRLFIPGLNFDFRHYNPLCGEICLLKRDTGLWQPSMTAARLITSMVPEWELACVRKYEDARLDTEDRQAEPKNAYFPGVEGQTVLIDTSWAVPLGISSGKMKIAATKDLKKVTASTHFVAFGLQLLSKEYNEINCATESIRSWVKRRNLADHTIPWIKLDAPPQVCSVQELASLLRQNPAINQAILTDQAKGRSGLCGICFPEEAPGGGQRDGWIFLGYRLERQRSAKKEGSSSPYWLVKADPAAERDLFERIPELSPLRQKSIAVFGLGCVGAPSALGLARAGIGELRLLDADFLSAGTACRWPFGLASAGEGKVKLISQFIEANYPFTKINRSHYPPEVGEDFRISLGDLSLATYDQMDIIEKMIDGADLVYDATAEMAINHLLSDLAKEKGVPYVTVSSRSGGWGGNVVRIRPDGDSGCFLCYLQALESKDIINPPYDPHGDELQPVGCGDLTFKAAGFDVEEISLSGVRMAVATLCAGVVGGYPSLEDDIGILSLRENGNAVFPNWKSYPLHKHPKCPRCNK
ncbi:ThiF family adenylyltransferase [Geotalea sp. SG265]|uniref:ThiF family adenylyltransferase n=1 Tax=Geotalea sp. SG265 TaxID=2922867 RepID=UPI001FAF0A79|nr:ThiF family adenylyltransferase [Geotalea sp. SG265]